MESMFDAMAGRMNQPNSITKEALNLHRRLTSKSSGLGLSSTFETAVCLHLSAEKMGFNVDVKITSQCAGAKSKPQYLVMLSNVKAILGLDSSSLHLQEIGVQLSAPDLVNQAKGVLDVYEKYLLNLYGAERTKSINLSKSLYLCAAFYAAGKYTQHKLETQRLVELAATKKKDVIELGDQMVALLSVRKEMSKKTASLSDSILGTIQEEPQEEPKDSLKRKMDESDGPTEDFQAWKMKILKKAVDAGFKQYEKYITPSMA